MNNTVFEPLKASAFEPNQVLFDKTASMPAVFKGLASQWPAVKKWDFAYLSSLVPDIEVKVVAGNREQGKTHFARSSLKAYLASLQGNELPDKDQLYLKEFDLLEAVPQLKGDLKPNELFPTKAKVAVQSWIGPAGARTGLHHDYLDNLAVEIVGKKRFYLIRPGVVERLGVVSSKYDSWATLAQSTAAELAEGDGKPGDYFFVDLEPGDVLHVPAGWWHEVTNLTPCLLFGGFYGTKTAVNSRWAWVMVRDLLHRMGWLGANNCTCHPAKRMGARSQAT